VAGFVTSLYGHGPLLLIFGLALLLLSCGGWWASVIREATYGGFHTLRVQSGLRAGILLFIVSEIFFFLGFFWAYLHCSLSPNIELGSTWPPPGVSPIFPFSVPLLNTVVLLSSGLTITYSHSCLLASSAVPSIFSLLLTILLGLFFSVLQAYEYYLCRFCISDSAYGSCFFLATGFHGLHVILGVIFLTVSLVRLLALHFSPSRHLGYLFSAWYWHFVDVIWLLLYLIIYIWGS